MEGEGFDCSKRSDDRVCYAAERLLRVWEVDGINHGVGVCAMEVHFSAETREREMDKDKGQKSTQLLVPVTADTMVPPGDRDARPLSSLSDGVPDRAICLSVALFFLFP